MNRERVREGEPLDFAQAIRLNTAGSPIPRAHLEGWSPDDLRVLFPR